MANERNDRDGLNESDVPGSTPLDSTIPADMTSASAETGPTDPNDEIPVPVAMWPSEIDERAQVVEALRGNAPPPRTDTQVDPA